MNEPQHTKTDNMECTVVFASNEKGVLPLSLALWSLLDTAAEHTIYDVRILSDEITDTSQAFLKSIVSGSKSRHKLTFVDSKPVLDEKIDEKFLFYLPRSAWARIFIPDIMPEVKKALYIDIDVLVCEDCTPLFTTDMQGAAMGVVYEAPSAPNSFFNSTFNIPIEFPGYFNSGVLLMDLEVFRRDKLSERVMHYAAKYSDKLIAKDQDALNAALYDKVFRLHPRWNWNDGNTRRFSKCKPYSPLWRAFEPKEVVEASLYPGILHFIGPHKPWKYNHRIMRSIYEDAIKRSGLPGFLPIPGWSFRTWMNRWLYAPMYARTWRKIKKLAKEWGISKAPSATTWGLASDLAIKGWPPRRDTQQPL